MEQPRVVRNEDKDRFEIYAGDELAGFVLYRMDGELIELIHTEVGPKFQGEGLAGQLARAALDTARAEKLSVLPYCPYVRRWMSQHPEYTDLVPENERAEFGLLRYPECYPRPFRRCRDAGMAARASGEDRRPARGHGRGCLDRRRAAARLGR